MHNLSQDLNSKILPSLFLSLLEALVSSESVDKLSGIIRSSDYNYRLLCTQATDLKHCDDICDLIVKKTSTSDLHPFCQGIYIMSSLSM